MKKLLNSLRKYITYPFRKSFVLFCLLLIFDVLWPPLILYYGFNAKIQIAVFLPMFLVLGIALASRVFMLLYSFWSEKDVRCIF